MGKWYVISSVPTVFEKEAHNALENYEWVDESKQKLRVTFTYHKGGFDKKMSTLKQDAYVVNKETGAEWKVRPTFIKLLPVWLPYIILEAVPDDYLVVGYPDRSYLWIMARKSLLPDDVYAKIEERCVSEWGYDKEKILKVPQQWPEEGEGEGDGEGKEEGAAAE